MKMTQKFKLPAIKTRKLGFLFALALSLSACTTATKNFESGTIPAYKTVDETVVETNKSRLDAMMDEQGVELSQSGAEFERVKRIIDRLSATADIQQSLDVYTAEAGEQVNAFAMGGNTIVVYNELLRRLPKDEELAVVLAHEVAHILGGHNGDRTMQKRSGAVGILGGLAQIVVLVATEGNADAGELAGAGVSALGTGVVLSYGRAMEHEADHIGMLLMAKSGYDPKNAIKVWGKASEVLGAGAGVSFLSSHPSHGNRKKRLEKDYVYAEPLYAESQSSSN